MPSEAEDNYRTVKLQKGVYREVEEITEQPDSLYRSVSEFVHEAVRMRLEQVKGSKKRT